MMQLKVYKTNLFGCLFLMFFISNSFGQKFEVLTEMDQKAFQKQAARKIRELEFRFQKITALNGKPEVQEVLIEATLRDFLPDAYIEVASTANPNGVPIPIENYLREKVAKYQDKYSIVSVAFISIEIDKIKRDSTNPRQYVIEYSVLQRWCANKNGEPQRDAEGLLNYTYCDSTTKWGKFVIKRVTTSSGSKWKLFYSNIDAKLENVERQ